MASWPVGCVLLPFLLSSILLLNHSVRGGDDDDEDALLEGLNEYRASLKLTNLTKNDNAACLADQLADHFRDQPCTNTTGTEPDPANRPDLLAKCHLNVSTTKDGKVMPACVPDLVQSLVLSNFTKSLYSEYLNDTKFTGVGIGSEGDWIVVVSTTNTTEGDHEPSITQNAASFPTIHLRYHFLVLLMTSIFLL